MNPASVKALYRIGVAYMSLKAFASARASLEKAHALAPSDALIRQSLRECVTKDKSLDAELARKMFRASPSGESLPSKAPAWGGGRHHRGGRQQGVGEAS